MSLGEKVQKSKGFRALLIIGIMLSAGILIGIFFKNSNKFDNTKIYGNYTGEIIFGQDSKPESNLILDFDGKGGITGSIEFENISYTIQDSDYSYIEHWIQFSFSFDDFNIYLSFNGTVSDDFSIIQGDLRYYESPNIILEGIFLISK
jgi:hypothetical protein